MQELQKLTEENSIVIIYFSNDACYVCKILKPKIAELVDKKYASAKMVYVDTEKSPVIAGQYRVFTIPTIDIYVENREHARFSRNVTMHDFENALSKPYDILFSEDPVD